MNPTNQVLLVATLLCVFSQSASAQNAVDFRVLSFNVKALPFLGNKNNLDRIGDLLNTRRQSGIAPDVVLLQESFTRHGKTIFTRSGYTHRVRGPDKSCLLKNGSGLEILSDHPLGFKHSRTFNSCAVEDCFASKGVLAVQVLPPSLPFPVMMVTTHLQAQQEHSNIRVRQIDDLAVFFARNNVLGSDIAIFAGDFNFRPTRPAYAYFRNAFGLLQHSGETCLGLISCSLDFAPPVGANEFLDGTSDHHFFYNPTGAGTTVTPVLASRNFRDLYQGKYLSDHWGYEVVYRIEW